MKRFVRPLVSPLLFLLLAGMLPLRAGIRVPAGRTDSNDIDTYITARMHAARIPGVAAVIVKGDQVVYLKGFGVADPAGRPVTPQTPFIIGSITKPFTALAIMQLVDAGKVELDAPVLRYIPWFRLADPQAAAQITVRTLINQTSGLPQPPTLVTWTWPDYPDAIERHVRLLADTRLDFPPGQAFEYSNANYVLLGAIVQAVSGQSYEDYIRQNIFIPLDMRNSYVSQDEAMQHGMASGYRWWFGFPVPVTMPYNRANLPAGYIISSAEDIGHFLISQMNGGRYRDVSVLSPEGIAVMQAEPPPGHYGMGWETARVNGRRLVNHDGGTANFQTSLFFDPETHMGVFLAGNSVSALDTFSSAHGTSVLDGITLRNVAESVLSIASDEPLPAQGIGLPRLTAVFDGLLLALTVALIASVVRIPARYRRLSRRGLDSAGAARLAARTALLHFAWPLALIVAALRVPGWILIRFFQPDLVAWLWAMAGAVVLKGLVEIGLIRRAFGRGR